jgi:hypothetical protein
MDARDACAIPDRPRLSVAYSSLARLPGGHLLHREPCVQIELFKHAGTNAVHLGIHVANIANRVAQNTHVLVPQDPTEYRPISSHAGRMSQGWVVCVHESILHSYVLESCIHCPLLELLYRQHVQAFFCERGRNIPCPREGVRDQLARRVALSENSLLCLQAAIRCQRVINCVKVLGPHFHSHEKQPVQD